VARTGPNAPATVLTAPGTDPTADPIVAEGTPRQLYLAVWGRGQDFGLPRMTS
jgi:hypothetical protein